jgi:hypothetical protein
MKFEKECRLCANYSLERKGKMTIFKCSQGYFNFKGIPAHEEDKEAFYFGFKPFKETLKKGVLPCGGSEFVLYKNSKWNYILNLENKRVNLKASLKKIQYKKTCY